jgi:hypothetical protein
MADADDEQVQRYFDGELSSEERARAPANLTERVKMADADDEQVQRYFDGELSSEERARAPANLTENDQMRLQALAEMRGLLTHTLAQEAADVDLWPGIAAALERERAAKQRLRRWRDQARRSGGAVGALLTMTAVAALIIFQPWHARSENDCDIERLETEGTVATVFHMTDMPRGPTTVIWTEEVAEED